jgi:uncharacterized membrane protein
MHADRTNRIVLIFVGLIGVAAGIGGLLAAGGVFGSKFQHKQLVANGFSRYVGQHGAWVWPVIAVVALVVVLLSILWLFRLLFATDRTRSVSLVSARTDREAGSGAAGRTTMTASALTQAVAQEIETYHGVTSVKARVLGVAADPTLAIDVTASRRVELAGLVQRVEQEAIAHARTALQRPDLPVKLDIEVTDKTVSRAG